MSVTINNDQMRVVFEGPFELSKYDLFLKCKKLPEQQIEYDWQRDRYVINAPARFAHLLGVDDIARQSTGVSFAAHLFDYQRFITDVSLRAKRYAVWADTGLGKTHVGCEYARQVAGNGRVLICTPLNIIEQWKQEALEYFGLELEQIHSREQMRNWCKQRKPAVGIVNPEKFIPHDGEDQKVSECNRLAGFVLDESSLLKSGGGTIKWARGVWDDILEIDVLDGWMRARDSEEEKHVCPLQLEVIRRCIHLYSAPGQLVMDPFMGIGSTAVVAISEGRNAVGFELKESYHRSALKNVERAQAELRQSYVSLFSQAEAQAGD